MNFISIEFAYVSLLFFPLYWSLHSHKRIQIALLILSAYLLYLSWSLWASAFLFIFTVYVWLAGRWINSAAENGGRRVLYACGVMIALIWLFLGKYYEFFRQAVMDSLYAMDFPVLLPVIDIVVPVGISFFTFQAITYLDWQSRIPAQRTSIVIPLLYLSFWPVHFSGPIIRAEEFYAQLKKEDYGRPKHIELALYYILTGIVQKIVFANWLGSRFVDEVFKYPEAANFLTVVSAAVAYALQIFLDFAGYTLIVTGLALLLGFTLPINFRQPYLSVSLSDFWRRWHISLSSFIRDYVYIPLGGNRKGFVRTQLNVLMAMVVSGLWHGASTTFLLWGGLHGLGLIMQNTYRRWTGFKIPSLLSCMLTFSFVCFTWIFFRADSSETIFALLEGMNRLPDEIDVGQIYLAVFCLLFFLMSGKKYHIEQYVVNQIRLGMGWRVSAIATAMIFLVILFGPSGVPDFIYYRF